MPGRRQRPGTIRAKLTQAGFTLVETLVVLTILGLAASLIAARGPLRSPVLEMQTAVSNVTQAVRLARSRAIATNRLVRFVVDPAARSFGIEGGEAAILPPSLAVAVTVAAEVGPAGQLAAIQFNGDGSASGGRIELYDGRRRSQVGIDWLTGRIVVMEVQ